jgi:hypothetical protein
MPGNSLVRIVFLEFLSLFYKLSVNLCVSIRTLWPMGDFNPQQGGGEITSRLLTAHARGVNREIYTRVHRVCDLGCKYACK